MPRRPALNMKTIDSNISLIRIIEDFLRHDYTQTECGRIILPLIILRRLDCLLRETEKTILDEGCMIAEGIDGEARRDILYTAASARGLICNRSQFNLNSLKYQGSSRLKIDFTKYLMGYNSDIRDLLVEKLKLLDIIRDLQENVLLWNVYECICRMDLHSDQVSNPEMRHLLEELNHRFPEMSSRAAGEYLASRDVFRYLDDLLLTNDREALADKNTGAVTGTVTSEISIEDMT